MTDAHRADVRATLPADHTRYHQVVTAGFVASITNWIHVHRKAVVSAGAAAITIAARHGVDTTDIVLALGVIGVSAVPNRPAK